MRARERERGYLIITSRKAPPVQTAMVVSRVAPLFELPDDISEHCVRNSATLRHRQRADLSSKGRYLSRVQLFHDTQQKFNVFAMGAAILLPRGARTLQCLISSIYLKKLVL